MRPASTARGEMRALSHSSGSQTHVITANIAYNHHGSGVAEMTTRATPISTARLRAKSAVLPDATIEIPKPDRITAVPTKNAAPLPTK